MNTTATETETAIAEYVADIDLDTEASEIALETATAIADLVG